MRARWPYEQDARVSRKEKLLERQIYLPKGVKRALSRLYAPAYPTVPTEDQRHLVLTSFVLGCVSIITAFFPICGLPIAVTGLLLGLYGHRTTALRTMSSWAVALSIIGLMLTFINIIVMISIFFSTYLWE